MEVMLWLIQMISRPNTHGKLTLKSISVQTLVWKRLSLILVYPTGPIACQTQKRLVVDMNKRVYTQSARVRFVMIHIGSCISFTLRCDNRRMLRSELLKISLKNSYQTKSTLSLTDPSRVRDIWLTTPGLCKTSPPSKLSCLTHS